jgi:acetoin utilization protein AcuB
VILIYQEFISTDPISDIRRVAKVMIDFKHDAIPVVNSNDILVGIVSKTNIINAVSHIPNLKLWA